jgi:eukaryotic-like serine/threonine-protein kinase
MPLSAGTHVGVYEITAQIGEGGMGQVYRARDTKLNRDVALKVLADAFASDPQRLARFKREAQVLASLNHPNIAHIHGYEDSDGIQALVMELVDGPTLADRVAEGPIPLDEALPIAKQIAEALEAAHEQGIIHRDLKPANIKVRDDGTIKVLDFGLAKAMEPVGAGTNVSPSQVITMPAMTQAGMILGTAAYMSPEQAAGIGVTKATDIWAFGCVLYELLTGHAAFQGTNSVDILAAVVRAEPDWSQLPAASPLGVQTLLRRCLRKDRRQRLQDATDVRLEIEDALDGELFVGSSGTRGTAKAGLRPEPHGWLVTTMLMLALAAALVPATLYFRRGLVDEPEVRFEMPAPRFVSNLVIAPDGRTVAYVASNEGKQAIWIGAIGSLTAHQLTGTDNASGLFWSPDSRYLGFVADGKLKKIAVSGEGPQVLCDAAIDLPGTWNRDDVILFGGFAASAGLLRVSASGGEVTLVTVADPSKEFIHIEPQFLPDGRHFLYHAVSSNQRDGALYLGSLDSKSTTRIMVIPNSWQGTNSPALYALPGYLLFSRDGRLMAQPFDTVRMTLSGEPVALGENVRTDFSVSDNGVLVYRKFTDQPRRQPAPLTWFDRRGKPASQVVTPINVEYLSLSRDGQQIAVDNSGPSANYNSDIWVIGVSRAASLKLTFDSGFDGSPIWDPDGSRIVWAAIRGGRVVSKLYQKRADGVGAEDLLLPGNASEVDVPQDWSSDGRYIIFVRYRFDEMLANDLWVLPLFGDKRPSLFLHTSFLKVQPQLSPDRRYLAYATNESGTYQIVVQSFPDPTMGKWPITAQGGTEPIWRRDGRELYYLAPDGRLMAVQVSGDHTLKIGQPIPLFQTILRQQQPVPGSRRYAVTADGQRFLMISSLTAPASDGDKNEAPITAIINWTAALKK